MRVTLRTTDETTYAISSDHQTYQQLIELLSEAADADNATITSIHINLKEG